MTRRRPAAADFECPQCGALVKAGAAACRECGSDAGTGWQSSEEIDYQSLELPDDAVPAPATRTERAHASRWFALVVIVAVAAFALVAVLAR